MICWWLDQCWWSTLYPKLRGKYTKPCPSTETAKTNLENFSKISVFIKIFSFQDRRLYISCHNLAELWPRTQFFSSKYLSRIPLKVSRRILYGTPTRLGDTGEDIMGSKWPPWVFMLIKRAWYYITFINVVSKNFVQLKHLKYTAAFPY